MQKLTILWSIFCCLGFLGVTARVQAEVPAFVLPTELKGLPLGRSMEILVDRPGQMSFEDLRKPGAELPFVLSKSDYPSLGYLNRGALGWGRFRLDNPSNQVRTVYIVCRYAPIDDITLAQQTAEGVWEEYQLGDQFPLSRQKIRSNYAVFPVTLQAGENQFMVRVQVTGSMSLPLQVWDPQAYLDHRDDESLLLGLLLGCCSVMFLYNLFVSIRFKSLAYYIYVVYIGAYTVFAFCFQGLLHEYVLSEADHAWFLRQGYFVFIDLVTISALLFTLVFLQVEDYFPKLARIFRLVCLFFVVNFILNLAEFGPSIRITILGNLLVSLVIMSLGIVQLRRVRYARYFVLAWSTLLSGNALLILAQAGVIQHSALSFWGQSIGAACELVFLSLALGDRMATINAERLASVREQQILQENLTKTERSRSLLQEELRQEAQFKVSMVSDLAHRINNPLNHVSISLSALDADLKKIERDVEALFEGEEKSEEVQDVLKSFRKKFGDSQSFSHIAGESARKVGNFVRQIRSISGVDGFAAQREDLPAVMQDTLQRLFENVGPFWKNKIRWHNRGGDDAYLMANRLALVLSFELVLRFWCDHCPSGFECEGNWSRSDDGCISYTLKLMSPLEIAGSPGDDQLLQLRYLLKPYQLNPVWTADGISLESGVSSSESLERGAA